MADLDAGIVAYLTSHTALSALVGQRVWPVRRPKGAALPAITFHRIAATRLKSHDGASGLAFPLYQFNVWAADHQSARTVAYALVQALYGAPGSMGFEDVPTVTVESDMDDWFSEMNEYRVLLGIRFHHYERDIGRGYGP